LDTATAELPEETGEREEDFAGTAAEAIGFDGKEG
jgi:hypothetical protein